MRQPQNKGRSRPREENGGGMSEFSRNTPPSEFWKNRHAPSVFFKDGGHAGVGSDSVMDAIQQRNQPQEVSFTHSVRCQRTGRLPIGPRED